MAIQLEMDELKGCITYFRWLFEQIVSPNGKASGNKFGGKGSKNDAGKSRFGSKGSKGDLSNDKFGSKSDAVGTKFGSKIDSKGSKGDLSNDKFGGKGAVSPSNSGDFGEFSVNLRQVELCRWLFSVDFWSDLVEDGTQAANAMEMRRRYAVEMGSKLNKTDREVDRIWKSVHGKCSVFEFFVYISNRLDDITNEEEEPGSTIWRFFEIILANSGLSKGAKIDDWQPILDKFLGRFYDQDGSNGGLFPLKTWSKMGQKDQRTVPIWYQMNNWINENLDENGCFLWKNWPKFG